MTHPSGERVTGPSTRRPAPSAANGRAGGGLATLPAILALAAPLLALPPSPAGAASLRDALEEAYRGNPDLTARRAAVRAADARVTRAWGGYLPTLKGSVQYQVQRGNERLIFNDSDPADKALFDLVEDLDADTTTYTLSLDQNLFQGGGTQAAVRGAQDRARSGRADLLATEESVLLDAATAYVRVWRDRHTVAEAEANLAGLRERLRKTRRMYELGEVTLTDVRQAEARLARGQAQLDQERASLADSEAFYQRAVGPLPAAFDRPPPLPNVPARLEEAEARAEGAPEIQRATHDVAAARSDVDAAFAGFFPSLDLSGQLNRQEDPNVFIKSTESASIGVKLTVPFFEGGVTLARLREGRATVEQRREELLSQTRQVAEGVQKAWDQLAIARSQAASYRAEVAANRLALEGVEREAQVGRRTTLDILDAQQDLFRSRLDALRAEADLVVATFAIKRSIGELTADGLGLRAARPADAAAAAHAGWRRLFGLDSGGD